MTLLFIFLERSETIMAKAKPGKIVSIIMAVGAGVMAVVTELSNNKREQQMEELIERVDKYLPKLPDEGDN